LKSGSTEEFFVPHLRPVTRSHGKQILHSLGWREGDGIGPKIVVGTDGKRISRDGSIAFDLSLVGLFFAPPDIVHNNPTANDDFGAGYEPLTSNPAPTSYNIESYEEIGYGDSSLPESSLSSLNKRMKEEVRRSQHISSTSLTSGMKMASTDELTFKIYPEIKIPEVSSVPVSVFDLLTPEARDRIQKLKQKQLDGTSDLSLSRRFSKPSCKDAMPASPGLTYPKSSDTVSQKNVVPLEFKVVKSVSTWNPSPLLCKRYHVQLPSVSKTDMDVSSKPSFKNFEFEVRKRKRPSDEVDEDASLGVLESSIENVALCKSIFESESIPVSNKILFRNRVQKVKPRAEAEYVQEELADWDAGPNLTIAKNTRKHKKKKRKP